MFNPLTEDIEPYYYEYYGSKDKAFEVGKILRKFDEVDEKGFFTMAATDGLEKNETISLVRQRYFIKVEGDNAVSYTHLDVYKRQVLKFTDVKPGDWFAKDVALAAEKGYVKGYEDGSFKPNSPITRQEIGTIIGSLLEDDVTNADEILSLFSDLSLIHI